MIPEALATPEPAPAPLRRRTIAILGAGGPLGRATIVAARAAGCDVRVLVRRPMADTDGIAVVVGDATRREDIERTITGADAVISLVGPKAGAPRDLSSRVSLELLHAARARGPRRVILVTGALVGAPNLGWFYRGLRRLIGLFAPGALEDRRTSEKVLSASTLDWTIVRPPRLTDGTSQARIGEDLVVGAFASIARPALAGVLVDLASSDRHVREAVVVMG